MQKENIELYKKWNDFETLFKKKISNEIKKKNDLKRNEKIIIFWNYMNY